MAINKDKSKDKDSILWNIVLFESGKRVIRNGLCTIIQSEDLSSMFYSFMSDIENMDYSSFDGRVGSDEKIKWISREGLVKFENVINSNLNNVKVFNLGLFLVDIFRGGDIGIIETISLNENSVTGSKIEMLVKPLINYQRIPEVAINLDIKRVAKMADDYYIKEAHINWVAAAYGDRQ